MRKITISVIILLLLISFGGCNRNKSNSENVQTTVSPSPQPVVTLPDEDTSGTDAEQNTNIRKVEDYFPIQADTEYVYEGKGNEYASYHVFTDFVDSANNKVQTRTDNGGTESIRVIQTGDGKVSVLYTVNECYYRDNLMDKSAPGEEDVLLMEPLVQGTQWTDPDGKKRYISAVDVEMATPAGTFKTLEVTTEGEDGTTKDYYAPQVGLVKSVYGSGDLEVSSTLSKINTNTPFTQSINVYYPNTDEKIYTEPLTLSFRTNDVTRMILVSALREEAVKESYIPLISENTMINSLYLGDDRIVYVDFSKDLVKDMNLGSGFESLVLQCITNTLGNYYGTEEVCITVDGKPYESGHIQLKKGETFMVNTELVNE